MRSNKWQEIEWARRMLGLPEQVTRKEIQDAYRARSRKVHPDLSPEADQNLMEELNRAYRTLMAYSDGYRMRLVPNEDGMTDEEWWMHHFGHDPVWGGPRDE